MELCGNISGSGIWIGMAGGRLHKGREETHEIIPYICDRLKQAGTAGELGKVIAMEVVQYSLHDLQHLRGVVEREIRHLPPAYQRKLRQKMMEQIFGSHHRLIAMYRRGDFDRPGRRVDESLGEYCDMVTNASHDALPGDDPRLVLLYYLLSTFTMFVLGEPGHPVGTPFPGGFVVELRKGRYYCPIRDKADDVEFSICPFCPALQMEGV